MEMEPVGPVLRFGRRFQLAARATSTPVVCTALVAAVLVVFGQTTDFAFTKYDDPELVLENPHVRAGLTLDGVRWAFTTGHAANWFPLTWFSHMLDCQLFGLDPGAHHGVNVALHGASSILLFLVLVRMTGARGRSAVVAALFALHPLHVETVAWVAERKGLLAGLFWMLTLGAYARYAERPGALRYFTTLGLFALGLLSKPVVVTLPFVLLLLDYWPLGRMRPGVGSARRGMGLVLEKLPFLVLAAGSSVITYAVQRSGGAMDWAAGMPFGLRLANALVTYVRYLGMLVWPMDLAVPYPHPGAWSLATVLAAALLLAAISIAAIVGARRRPYLLVGWLWFTGTLVPAIGLVQVGTQSMADRYTYLPAIGIFLAVSWAGAESLGQRRVTRALAAGTVAVALLACMVVSFRQARHWRDSVSLFSRAVAVTRDNAQAHYNLAEALREERGRTRDALPHLREAVRISPAYSKAHWALGAVLSRLGSPSEAAAELREAARLDPAHFRTRLDLATALVELGEERQAIEQLREAVRLRPDSALALNNLAWLLAAGAQPRVRDGAEAVLLAKRACELTAYRDPGLLATLAVAHAEAGEFADAARIARDARPLAEGHPGTVQALSRMLEDFEQGRRYREEP